MTHTVPSSSTSSSIRLFKVLASCAFLTLTNKVGAHKAPNTAPDGMRGVSGEGTGRDGSAGGMAEGKKERRKVSLQVCGISSFQLVLWVVCGLVEEYRLLGVGGQQGQ